MDEDRRLDLTKGQPEVEAMLSAVRALAEMELWPTAVEADGAVGLSVGHLGSIADLGLFSMVAPRRLGGLGLAPGTIRSVLRHLGGGCGATAFAFAQHHGVVGALAATDNLDVQERWLGPLCDRTLGGTAFAHVRRPGRPAILATRTDGGWRLDGEAPWATSWGTAAAFSVAAVDVDGRLVWVLAPGRSGDGLEAGPPLSLMVFGSTNTVRLRFEGFEVTDRDVLAIEDLDTWRIGDRLRAARPNPLCLGVGDRALALLAEIDAAYADDLKGAWVQLCDRAEEAVVGVDQGVGELTTVAAVRSETVLAAQRMTTALLAASGGRGAEASHPAQLLARQALFFVVQAQNADGREATLAALRLAQLSTT